MEHREPLDMATPQLATSETPEENKLERVSLAGREVDLRANAVLRDGEEQRITPKAAGVLRVLVGRPQEAVGREELLDEVWRDAYPTDDVLSHAITELRRALGDNARSPELIETIPKVGYRLLVQPVVVTERVQQPLPDASTPSSAAAGFRSLAALVLAGLLGGVLGAVAMRWHLDDQLAAPAAGTPVNPLASAFPVTAGTGRERMPAVTRDGRQVAYAAETDPESGYDLYIMTLGSDTATRLTDTPGDSEFTPSWSPNGDQVAFFRYTADDDCGLFIKPVVGGFERRLSDCAPDAITYIDWSPDGRHIALTGRLDVASTVSGVLMLNVQSGDLSPLDYRLSDSEHDVQPRYSPDGDHILFRRGAFPRSELYVVPSQGGEPRQLTEFGSQIFGFDWLPDGETVWFCSDQSGRPALWELTMADASSRLIGPACPYMLSVASDQRVLAFESIEEDPNIVEAITAGDGQHIDLPVFQSTQHEGDPAYAPDGRRVIYVSDRSGEDQLWIGDLVTEENYQLTRHQGLKLIRPRWSPDGQRIVYIGRGGGEEALYRINVISGVVEQLSDPGESVRSADVSYDGSRVLYTSNREGNWDIWALQPETGQRRRLTREGGHRPMDPRGDGYVYYTKLNIFGLWRVPLAGGEEELVTDEVVYYNHESWMIRGDSIYLPLGTSATGAAIHRLDLSEPWQSRSVLPLNPEDQIRLHDVSPDGDRFLLVRIRAPRQDILAVDGW